MLINVSINFSLDCIEFLETVLFFLLLSVTVEKLIWW